MSPQRNRERALQNTPNFAPNSFYLCWNSTSQFALNVVGKRLRVDISSRFLIPRKCLKKPIEHKHFE